MPHGSRETSIYLRSSWSSRQTTKEINHQRCQEWLQWKQHESGWRNLTNTRMKLENSTELLKMSQHAWQRNETVTVTNGEHTGTRNDPCSTQCTLLLHCLGRLSLLTGVQRENYCQFLECKRWWQPTGGFIELFQKMQHRIYYNAVQRIHKSPYL